MSCSWLLCTIVFGQDETPSLAITPILSQKVYLPGDTVILGLKAAIPAKYHLYGNPLGPGIGKPLFISISGGEGVRWLDIAKIKAKKYAPPIGEWVWAYEKEAFFFIKGIAERTGENNVRVDFDALICHTSCFPINQELQFVIRIDSLAAPERQFAAHPAIVSNYAACTETMPLRRTLQQDTATQGSTALSSLVIPSLTTAQKNPAWNYSPTESASKLNLLLAVFLGFLAGIILNAMPCVLPVLGVKILSFAQGQVGEKGKALVRSLAYATGILSVFMLLAGLAVFADFSWGKHFQDPRALIAIIAIIVVFALGMFDVYLITVPGSIANLEQKTGPALRSDFFKGVFATILATPCSGPFLGAVLAWSMTQSPLVVFVVYGSIGAGMAFPYVLISSSRRLARFVPKPGRWMEDFKKLMGFLLLGFAVYLLFGLPHELVVPTVLFCVITGLAIGIFGRFAPYGSSLPRKIAVSLLAVVVIGSGCYTAFFVALPVFSLNATDTVETGGSVWKPFSADSLLAAHAAGRHAVVDFTANWCMNCKYNEVMVLDRKDVMDLIKKKNILALKADMTMPDPVQDSLLRHLGSQSIPFLAVFPGNRPNEPIVMRDVLTKGKFVKVLSELQ